VCEQVVDWLVAGSAESYGVPGPLQVIVDPSPVFQITYDGVAVAVAATHPPTLQAWAVVESECHMADVIQSHSARFTYPVVDGLRVKVGVGSCSSLAARAPATAGSGGGTVGAA
jgi:hypothetical protein